MFLNIRSQKYLKVLYLGLVFSNEIYGRLQEVHFRTLEPKNAKPVFFRRPVYINILHTSYIRLKANVPAAQFSFQDSRNAILGLEWSLFNAREARNKVVELCSADF